MKNAGLYMYIKQDRQVGRINATRHVLYKMFGFWGGEAIHTT
jgi:hypothetical protein